MRIETNYDLDGILQKLGENAAFTVGKVFRCSKQIDGGTYTVSFEPRDETVIFEDEDSDTGYSMSPLQTYAKEEIGDAWFEVDMTWLEERLRDGSLRPLDSETRAMNWFFGVEDALEKTKAKAYVIPTYVEKFTNAFVLIGFFGYVVLMLMSLGFALIWLGMSMAQDPGPFISAWSCCAICHSALCAILYAVWFAIRHKARRESQRQTAAVGEAGDVAVEAMAEWFASSRRSETPKETLTRHAEAQDDALVRHHVLLAAETPTDMDSMPSATDALSGFLRACSEGPLAQCECRHGTIGEPLLEAE